MEVPREVRVQFIRDGMRIVFVAAGFDLLAGCDEIGDIEAALRSGFLRLEVIQVERIFRLIDRRLAEGALVVLVVPQLLANLAFAILEEQVVKLHGVEVSREIGKA
jgi:hypothetical protein